MHALALKQTLDRIECQLYNATADAVLGRNLDHHRSELNLGVTVIIDVLQERKFEHDDFHFVFERMLDAHFMVLEIIDRAIIDKSIK